MRRLGWSPPLGELLAQRAEQPQGSPGPEGGLFMAMRPGQQHCLPRLEHLALLVTVSEPETEWIALDERDQQIELTPENRKFLQEEWANHRRSIAARFVEQMPAGRVAAVPKAHHMIFLSHPEETLLAMRQFLDNMN